MFWATLSCQLLAQMWNELLKFNNILDSGAIICICVCVTMFKFDVQGNIQCEQSIDMSHSTDVDKTHHVL